MALRPKLDLELCCIRVTIPGNWKVMNGGCWEDFKVGRKEAVRSIRHRGRKYWVTVRNCEEDGFAALVWRGLSGSGPRSYRHFTLYRLNPMTHSSEKLYRLGECNTVNLGGVGVITRIGRVIKGEGWNARLAEANDLVVASCHPRRSQISDLAYGWVSAHLLNLIEQFGPLERMWLSSIYPRPSQGWKEDWSFLLDKYVHDIDVLLRWLSRGKYEADSMMDSYDHYEVKGRLSGVSFECIGTRLHQANDDFIEVILLGFARGNKGRSRCAVYSKTGRIRFYDGKSGRQWEERITPMESEGYDRVFVELMQNFAESIRGGQGTHTFDELRDINKSAVALAGPAGSYRSA